MVLVAGTERIAAYSGSGLQATASSLKLPSDILVTPTGDIFIADTGNSVVRKVGI